LLPVDRLANSLEPEQLFNASYSSSFVKPVTMSTNPIDFLTAVSLWIEATANGHSLMTATGFIVARNRKPYLITNWHVLSGRNPETNAPLHPSGAVPDSLRINHHKKWNGPPREWLVRTESLYDSEDKPRWLEHRKGSSVDVVALPLAQDDDEISIISMPLNLGEGDIKLFPSMPVSVIGYPFGLTAGKALPIWKTGHIATDPHIDYDDRPSFLIDATTREGMSGSPVAAYVMGSYASEDRELKQVPGPTVKFLGIYSGRIREDVELGRVWRPGVIDEVLSQSQA
jgi:hypothetical protein